MRITTAALLLASTLIGTGCIEGYEAPRTPGTKPSTTDDSRGEGKCKEIDADGDTVYLNSDDDIADFDAPEGCWDLYDDLVIDGEAVTSLAGLGGLRSVDNLTITHTSLTRFDSQRVIESLGTTVIADNADLEELRNLRLRRWEGDLAADLALEVTDNPKLADLGGLESIRELDGALVIEGNDALTELSLSSLKRVGSVSIEDNESLERIELDALTEALEIEVRDNPALVTFERTEIEELRDLTLDNNDALRDLDGFDGIERITGELSLVRNATLSNIDAIFAMQGVVRLVAMDNASLSTCRVASLTTCANVYSAVNQRNQGDIAACPATPVCN